MPENRETSTLLELLIGAIGAVYNPSPIARTPGERGGLEVDAQGNLKVAVTADIRVDIDENNLATGAGQITTNASLSSIDTKLSSQTTAAAQTAGNASLASIDGKLGSTAVAAAADGEAAATTMGTVRTRLMVYGGTTWAMLRAGITTVSATVTGFANTLPWALFHALPLTRTEAQGGPLETDVKGNLRISEQAPPAYENVSDACAQTHAKPATSAAFNAIPYDSLAKANAGCIKPAPGNLYTAHISNGNAAAQPVAFVNKASNGASADLVLFWVMVPGGGMSRVEFMFGKRFSVGIAWGQGTTYGGTSIGTLGAGADITVVAECS